MIRKNDLRLGKANSLPRFLTKLPKLFIDNMAIFIHSLGENDNIIRKKDMGQEGATLRTLAIKL